MSEVEQVDWNALQRFLQNVPGAVLLEVAQPGCPACEAPGDLVGESLPKGIARAKLVLDPDDPKDQQIADALGVESTPTFIGFCMGEELGRGRIEEVPELVRRLQACTPVPESVVTKEGD